MQKKVFVFSQNKQPIIMALLLCFYYVAPHLLSIGIELAFLFYLITRNRQPSKRFLLPFYWYGIFSLLLFFTNFYRIDFNNSTSTDYFRTTINCSIFVLIACLAIKDKKDLDVFLKAFGLMGIVICIILIPAITKLTNMGGGRLGVNAQIEGNAFLSNAINLGYILMLINICQFIGIINTHRKMFKLLFIFSFVFSFFCILMSGTRKALIGCIACYVFYVIYQNKGIKLSRLFYSFFFFFIIYLLDRVIVNVDFLYNSIGIRMEGFLSIFISNNSLNIDDSTLLRESLIRLSYKVFYNNPLIGGGIQETLRVLSPMTHPHNNYLSCLSFGGVVTFIGYYWLYLKTIVKYLKMPNKESIDRILMGLLFSLIIVDYTATSFNIIFFPTFISLIYLNSLFNSKEINTVR